MNTVDKNSQTKHPHLGRVQRCFFLGMKAVNQQVITRFHALLLMLVGGVQMWNGDCLVLPAQLRYVGRKMVGVRINLSCYLIVTFL